MAFAPSSFLLLKSHQPHNLIKQTQPDTVPEHSQAQPDTQQNKPAQPEAKKNFTTQKSSFQNSENLLRGVIECFMWSMH